MDGAAWRRIGRSVVLEPWLEVMEDPESGLFHNAYNDDFEPQPSDAKIPWVMARQAFGLCAGYLMYAEPRLVKRAREVLTWLTENAWDSERGGWFEKVRADGTVVDDKKREFNQLYVDTGLAFCYLVTGDEWMGEWLERSRTFRMKAFGDPKVKEGGEYFRELARDLSVTENRKDFVGHIVPLSGPGLYRYLATRDTKGLEEMQTLLRLVSVKMRDPEHNWILERFDPEWNYDPKEDATSEVDIGHNLEFAWVALRVYELTGDEDLRAKAIELAEQTFKRGFIPETGMWLHKIARDPSGDAKDYTHWWVQEYGVLMSLVMYAATGEERYLDVYRKSAEFFQERFLDPDKGDCFLRVTVEDGTYVGERRPNSAYHTMEFVLLVSLYLDLYVNKQPAELHFRTGIRSGETAARPLTLIEDASVLLKHVEIDGSATDDVDAQRRTARIPEGDDRDVLVKLRR